MKPLDLEWLLQQADTDETKEQLLQINAWREHTLKTNELSTDATRFLLHLNGLVFQFKVSSAFSAIEIYQEIFRNNNHFEEPEFNPCNAQVMLDVGANQGFFSLRAKQLNPDLKIIAFEPNPYEYEVLTKNIELNNLTHITPIKLALADHHGEIEFELIPQIGPIGGECVKIPERKWVKDDFIEKIRVKTTTLDQAIQEHALEKIDILKIDVEGAEMKILAPCTCLNRVQNIVLEYHSDQLKTELIDLLTAQGFKKTRENSSPENYYGDLYFSQEGRL